MKDTKFICEFTTNHLGNLNLLLEMVKQAAMTGADYIKMQKKDVANFYSKEKLESSYLSPYGKTYYDYRKIFEFSKRDFDVFDEECKKHKIKWFSTAQDINSLEFLLNYDLPMYKVASCNAQNKQLLNTFRELIPKSKTVVVSVAGLELKEVESTIKAFPDHKMIINHCVAEYPCKIENLRFGNIKALKECFEDERITIGYSGHEEGIIPTYAAIESGASCIERHFCMSRHSFAHHIECSLEPEEYREMVQTVRSGKIPKDINKIVGESAFQTTFGMTEMEKSFLKNATYGEDFIKEKAEL